MFTAEVAVRMANLWPMAVDNNLFRKARYAEPRANDHRMRQERPHRKIELREVDQQTGDYWKKLLKLGVPLPVVLRRLGLDEYDIDTFPFATRVDPTMVEMFYYPALKALTIKEVLAASYTATAPRRKLDVKFLPPRTATTSNAINKHQTVWIKRTIPAPAPSNSSPLLIDRVVAMTPLVPPKQQRPAIEVEASIKAGSELIFSQWRSRNLHILLRSLQLTGALECRRQLQSFTFDAELAGSLHLLIQQWPCSIELQKIRSFQGDAVKLALADRFFVELLDVPRLKIKFECIAFGLNFRTRYDALSFEIRAMCRALQWFIESHEFALMMQQILRLLCFANSYDEAALGDRCVDLYASGFHLSSLPMLLRIKSANKRVTLLQAITVVLKENNLGASSFAHELLEASRALKSASIPLIRSEIRAFDAGHQLLSEEAEAADTDLLEFGFTNGGVLYQDRVKLFACEAELKLGELHRELRELNSVIRRFKTYCEEPESTSITDLISHISTFAEAYAVEMELAQKKRS